MQRRVEKQLQEHNAHPPKYNSRCTQAFAAQFHAENRLYAHQERSTKLSPTLAYKHLVHKPVSNNRLIRTKQKSSNTIPARVYKHVVHSRISRNIFMDTKNGPPNIARVLIYEYMALVCRHLVKTCTCQLDAIIAPAGTCTQEFAAEIVCDKHVPQFLHF